MNSSETKNPLIRDGVAQQQRQMPALDPNFAQIDERDLADFLVFAHDLSKRITYFGLNNQADGSWQPFFEQSAPIQIARISKTRPDSIRHDYAQALERLISQWVFIPAAQPGDPASQLAQLEAVFNVYVRLLNDLQTWYKGLNDGSELKSTLKASVKTNLSYPLRRLYRLEQGLTQSSQHQTTLRRSLYAALVDTFGRQTIPEIDQSRLEQQRRSVEQRRPFALALRQLLADQTAVRTELDGIFQPLFQTYRHIIQLAPRALQTSLYKDQSLPPHLSMLVAFWEVLKPARIDLNQMTRRHLDFFYREVLQLSERPAQPDKAHIVLTLAKFQQEFSLTAQTPFTAGEDATGAGRRYTLDDDTVINTAQVAEIKSLFLQRSTEQAVLSLHGSSVANSYDGLGQKFPKSQSVKAWLPFGDRSRPTAELGLAIASNILLLTSGDRTLTFDFTLRSYTPPGTLTPADWRIDFSGETDWIRATIRRLDFVPPSAPARPGEPLTYRLILEAHLPVQADAVVPYHRALPGGKLVTEKPAARLMSPAYGALHKVQLEHLVITAHVTGLRTLHLQTDLATLEANQPFAPFGPQPKPGATVYIGSQEALQKQLTSLNVSFELETPPPANWQEIYAAYGVGPGFNPGTVTIQALQSRQWHPAPPTVIGSLFSTPLASTQGSNLYQINLTNHIASLNLSHGVADPQNSSPLEPWTHHSQYGFLRWQLTGDDFRHSDYPNVLARQVLAAATQEIVQGTEVAKEALEKAEKAVGPAQKRVNDAAILVSAKNSQLAEKARAVALLQTTIGPRQAFLQLLAQTQPVEAGLQLNLLLLPLRAARQARDQAQRELNTANRNMTIAQQSLAQVLAAQKAAEAEAKRNKRRAIVGAYYRRGANSQIFVATSRYVEPNDEPILPEAPYTPVIKSMQLDYGAEATQTDCQLFHLHPFHGTEALSNADNRDALPTVLPTFEQEGELFIGLQNLEPAIALSLLVQVAESTADTDVEKAKTTWHYLINNSWKPFEEHQVLSDKTNGLIQSGIVKLAIPADINNAHTTVLAPTLHWLKVCVPSRSRAISHILSIQAQAAEVTFIESGNDPNHLAVPLPAQSIANFVDAPPEVKEIQQPYASFAGKRKEQPAHFYTRISEHLRHKGRAVNIFDYEHLVLNQFPEIYKVRCINHGQMVDKSRLHEVSPGHITLAVIPALSLRPTMNELEPKVNISLLTKIEQYLRSVSSPWASLSVINPLYDPISVSFRVRLQSPFHANFAFYQRQLQQDIIGFLSPWTVNGEAEIHFGGEIYRSSIIKFVEDQPYVDYVLDFQLFQGNKSLTKVSAQTPHSILVSVPFSEENLLPVEVEGDRPSGPMRHRIIPIDTLDSQLPRPARSPALDNTKNELGYSPLSALTLGE